LVSAVLAGSMKALAAPGSDPNAFPKDPAI
jgi:hypothetical protein